MSLCVFFFFKQKTAYEMRISDWSSDVCSSDLYGIYVYATFADATAGGYKLRDAYMKTLKMTGKAVVFTGITLGIGVATWLWSGLQFQRDMGKLLVFMFTANMFGAILLLPAIASYLLKPKELAPGEEPRTEGRRVGTEGVNKG